MYEDLRLPRLLKSLEQVCEEFPDKRTGDNTQYDLADAGLGAFTVFFTQTASFLAQQRTLKTTKGWSNAERLFGLHSLPSDNQIRNLLDPVVERFNAVDNLVRAYGPATAASRR